MSDADVQQGITVDLVLQHSLDTQKIYRAYVEMGGMNAAAEVRGYLTGSSSLLQLQRDMVSQAVNEQLSDPHRRTGCVRAPYSSASIARAGGYASSELDGEHLREHSRPPHHSVPMARDSEADRLVSLDASGLLGRSLTGPLERLPRMTRAYFDVMGAAITLITANELITKSLIGTLEGAMPREQTFCNQTIRFDRTLVIPDTLEDPRFKHSPYVTGPPSIRFYAGHPIHGPGNMRIGALCIIDDNPRTFTSKDEHKLRTLAALVQLEIWTPPT